MELSGCDSTLRYSSSQDAQWYPVLTLGPSFHNRFLSYSLPCTSCSTCKSTCLGNIPGNSIPLGNCSDFLFHSFIEVLPLNIGTYMSYSAWWLSQKVGKKMNNVLHLVVEAARGEGQGSTKWVSCIAAVLEATAANLGEGRIHLLFYRDCFI